MTTTTELNVGMVKAFRHDKEAQAVATALVVSRVAA